MPEQDEYKFHVCDSLYIDEARFFKNIVRCTSKLLCNMILFSNSALKKILYGYDI